MGERIPEISELIRQARAGDAPCRERLFGLCRSYLGFVARSQVESWLRAKVDASDLVQETMLEAYRDFARSRGGREQEWLAWLKRILAPQCGRFRAALSGHRQAAGRPRGGLSRSGRQHDGRRRARAGRPRRHAQPGVSADRRRVADDRRLGRTARRLPGSDRAAEPGAAVRSTRWPSGWSRSRPAVQMLWMRAIRKLQEVMGPEESP